MNSPPVVLTIIISVGCDAVVLVKEITAIREDADSLHKHLLDKECDCSDNQAGCKKKRKSLADFNHFEHIPKYQ